MKSRLAAVGAALLALAVAGVPAAQAEGLSLERVFQDPSLSGPGARGVRFSPDGRSVTYIRSRPDDQTVSDLWIADVAGGEPRMLVDSRKLAPVGRELSEAEKARRERQGVQTRGVVDYQWDSQGRYILTPVEGDLWLYDVASARARQLTDTPASETDAKVSPRGGFVSFVRDDNLSIVDVATGSVRALTTDGTELNSWATAEFVAQEEMDRDTGYWWSPDDTRIALTRVDASGVDVVARTDVNAVGAVIVDQRYPRPGRPNARVDLFVLDLASGGKTAIDLGSDPDFYLARVAWSRKGDTLYIQRQSRDQKRVDLLAADPATGKTRVVLSETSPFWVDLTHDFRELPNGDFIWSSERSGARQLYVYGANGKLRRTLTAGAAPVAGLLGVDETRGTVIFAASLDTPTEQRIYETSYRRRTPPKALTAAGGWWDATVASRGGAFVGVYQDPATPPRTGLYTSDGALVRWIEENRLDASHAYHPYLDRHRTPEFGSLKAADGQELMWMMRTPHGFDPARRYPVIIQVYGGPARALVQKRWQPPVDQALLEAGFILFTLDNRGTPGRDVAFKTAIAGRMGIPETDDQLRGVGFLKTLPYVDADRIGMTGWSQGGYMTLLMLTAPDSPVKAGVAGAPPTDWSLYDTHYTERFMGAPTGNAAGYAATDIVTRAANLKPGALMLIHGMADDNVTLDHTTRLMAALQARGVAFETMLYPGLRHRAGWTPQHLLHRWRTTLDFFNRTLKPAGG